MQIFQRKDDRREIEASDVCREPLSAAKVRKELSTGDVRHQHVNIQAVLESCVEVDDEGVMDAGKDVSFGVHMFNLS